MAKYKAKTSFNYYKLITVGDIIELDSIEYARMSHVVTPMVEYSEPVSTIEEKPNKKYTKGRRKKI